MLSGVSIDYYTRLEQGRERRPSEQVLEALARALRLDADAREHLYELAHPRAGRRGPIRDGGDQVSSTVLRLVDGWKCAFAVVVNRRLDVLARNRQAAAFFHGVEHNDNLLRLTFLNPVARELYVDWDKEARFKVAYVRAKAGADLEDPSLVELVEELSHGSEDFRRLWARHEVRGNRRKSLRLHHPVTGDMTLDFEILSIDAASGLCIFVGVAEPGSPSEDALARLGDLMTADGPARR